MPLYLYKKSAVLYCFTAGTLRGPVGHSEGLGMTDGRLTAWLQPTGPCTMADGEWQAGRMEDNIVSSIIFTLKDLNREKAQNGSVKLWFVLYRP